MDFSYKVSIEDRCKNLPFDALEELGNEDGSCTFLDNTDTYIDGYIEQLLDRSLTWDNVRELIGGEVESVFNIGFLAGCLCGYKKHAELLGKK
ncbi:MAG: hypothetical protein J6T22_09430 [Bacteroidales bacterium]|nr:hypothetical protein [Bacteroidales bacterium]MBO7617415.1 hypothetical protein [Bacteroidales bacterium]